MSTTVDFLNDPGNLTAETKELLASDNPRLAEIGQRHPMRRRIVCNDGFTMSVQYSSFHYCNARSHMMGGDWDGQSTRLPAPRTVEVGFPNRKDRLLKPYAEEWYRATQTVYAYVPVEVVDQVIARHGGIKEVQGDY